MEEERPCPKVIWASTLCIVHCYFNIFTCSIYQRKAASLQAASTQTLIVLEFSDFSWCEASTRLKCDGLLSHLGSFNLSLCLASVLVRSSPSLEGLRAQSTSEAGLNFKSYPKAYILKVRFQ